MKDVRDHGEIRWFKVDAGYGFIRTDASTDDDVFFHLNEVKAGTPKTGKRVTYFVAPSRRHPGKLVATDVEVLP